MKKLSLALSFALSLAAIAALRAQTSPTAEQNQSPAHRNQAPASQDQAPASGKEVTVTGCLERAVRNPPLETGSAVGTSGSDRPSSTATDQPIIRSDTKWVLTASAGKEGSGETVGTSGRAPRLEYRLDVPDESTLAAHEGHRVRITGTVEEGRAAGAGDKDAKLGSGRRAPLLKIESVKMIADDCAR